MIPVSGAVSVVRIPALVRSVLFGGLDLIWLFLCLGHILPNRAQLLGYRTLLRSSGELLLGFGVLLGAEDEEAVTRSRDPGRLAGAGYLGHDA